MSSDKSIIKIENECDNDKKSEKIFAIMKRIQLSLNMLIGIILAIGFGWWIYIFLHRYHPNLLFAFNKTKYEIKRSTIEFILKKQYSLTNNEIIDFKKNDIIQKCLIYILKVINQQKKLTILHSCSDLKRKEIKQFQYEYDALLFFSKKKTTRSKKKGFPFDNVYLIRDINQTKNRFSFRKWLDDPAFIYFIEHVINIIDLTTNKNAFVSFTLSNTIPSNYQFYFFHVLQKNLIQNYYVLVCTHNQFKNSQENFQTIMKNKIFSILICISEDSLIFTKEKPFEMMCYELQLSYYQIMLKKQEIENMLKISSNFISKYMASVISSSKAHSFLNETNQLKKEIKNKNKKKNIKL